VSSVKDRMDRNANTSALFDNALQNAADQMKIGGDPIKAVAWALCGVACAIMHASENISTSLDCLEQGLTGPRRGG
jgi:hypothetical protein